MAWTTPASAVTGDVVPASFWNTYGRDNLAYLKGLLDGTGGSTVVTVPSTLRWGNDALAYLDFITSTRPYIGLDSNDYIEYDRSTNTFKLHIGSNDVLTIDANGKVGGNGFYDSGAQSITSGGSANHTHGLGVRPRFYSGVWSTSNDGRIADESSASSVTIMSDPSGVNGVYFAEINSGYLTMGNNNAATLYYRVFAMR